MLPLHLKIKQPPVWGYGVQFKTMNLGYFAEGSISVTNKR